MTATTNQTQISFVTQADLKSQSMKKVKSMGMTLKAYLNFCLQALVRDEIEVGVQLKQKKLAWTDVEQADWELFQQEKMSNDAISIEAFEAQYVTD